MQWVLRANGLGTTPILVKPFIINYLRLSLPLVDEFAQAAQLPRARYFLVPVLCC